VATRVRGSFGLLGMIYIIVGVFVAWINDYITVDLLRRVASALLAVLLWFLVLLDVNLRIPG
jgi:membrane-bound ClpP family serine protease